MGERFAQARRELHTDLFELGGEKAVALFTLIEIVSFSHFLTRRDGHDTEVLAGIQSLRRTLSPLHVPSPADPVFAEKLKKEYDAWAKQEPRHMLDTQRKTDVLDRALSFIQEFSGQGFQSQRFLTGLLGYIKTHHPTIADQVATQQEAGRIIVPGQPMLPPPEEPHQHDHTCDHEHHHH